MKDDDFGKEKIDHWWLLYSKQGKDIDKSSVNFVQKKASCKEQEALTNIVSKIEGDL